MSAKFADSYTEETRGAKTSLATITAKSQEDGEPNPSENDNDNDVK